MISVKVININCIIGPGTCSIWYICGLLFAICDPLMTGKLRETELITKLSDLCESVLLSHEV